MPDIEWVGEERPVPDGLEEDFEAEPYPKPATKFNTIADQLNEADRETLRLYVAGVTAPGAWRNTEIGTE